MSGKIPAALDIPTGLGKTKVMAIWLLALSSGAALPRRLVYVVDRRAVVDQASAEAAELAGKCRAALGIDMAISTLRGQHTDAGDWRTDPSRPAIVVGTVDMIGSRLLFEGYGVRPKMRPMHAGLLGVDTLVVLDEAHLVPPFEALLRAIESDRGLHARDEGDRELIPRLRLLPLSATGRDRDTDAPAGDGADCAPLRLCDKDRAHPVVKQRLEATKRLHIEPPGDGKDLVTDLATRAWDLAEGDKRVLVYCNSRTDAGNVEAALKNFARKPKREIATQLMVGARRVLERERLVKWLCKQRFLAGGSAPPDTSPPAAPRFLVATAAGEVGVDLDADHMVCDLVEWERMVQRLGRVNRRGDGDARIDVFAAPPKEKKRAENWATRVARLRAPLDQLREHDDGSIDASPGAIDELKRRADDDAQLRETIALATTPEPLRPALTRPLVDAWSMTSLDEHTGRPEIEPWLRGWVDDDKPQTVVVWRRWLPWREGENQPDARQMGEFFERAPLHLTELLETLTKDVLDTLIARAGAALKPRKPAAGEDAASPRLHRRTPAIVVLDRRGKCKAAMTAGELSRLSDKAHSEDKNALREAIVGKRVVVATALGGLSEVGLLDKKADHAPPTLDGAPAAEGWSEDDLQAIGYRVLGPDDAPPSEGSAWREEDGFALRPAEDEEDERRIRIFVWRGKGSRRAGSQALARREQELSEHQASVVKAVEAIGDALHLPEDYRHMLTTAARVHDEGKRHWRWQQAFNAPRDGKVYGKTVGPLNTRLLDGYRHEFGSLPVAEADAEFAALRPDLKDLALHLIASHHGHARPVISTSGCTDAHSALEGRALEVALRFAELQARWGPWGLAWWEAVFRAADQQASREHDEAGGTGPTAGAAFAEPT